jgi:hypothetical protein
MSVIYLKLGSVNDYVDERLAFHLNDLIKPAGALEYENLNEDITRAINAGQLVQISNVDYFNLINTLEPSEAINVTTSYLVTLQNYYNGCPADTSVFFIYDSGQWYKALWSTLKSCIASRTSYKFRIGETDPPYPIPADTQTAFQHNGLKNKNPRNLTITAGGVEIHEASMYDPAELASGDIDYYTLDPATGTITRPATFSQGEFISITEA